MKEQNWIDEGSIKTAFGLCQTFVIPQIKRLYEQKRMSRGVAISVQQSLAQGQELLLHIADMGLTPQIVIDWLEREMEICEGLSKKSK